MSNNIFEYVKVINQKSKNAFDNISRSSSKDRNLAILNTSLIIKKKQTSPFSVSPRSLRGVDTENGNDRFFF